MAPGFLGLKLPQEGPEHYRNTYVQFGVAGVLWSLAAALIYLDLHILPSALSPIAAAFSDWRVAAVAMMGAGRRFFVPSLAVYVLLGVFSPWLRGFDLRAAAPFAPFIAILVAEEVDVRGFLFGMLPAAAVLGLLAYWAHRSGESARRCLHTWLPASIAVLGAIGLFYRWSGYHLLRELIGPEPVLGTAAFVSICSLAALPVLWMFKGVLARLVLVAAVVWFLSLHSFDDNFIIYSSERHGARGAAKPHVIMIVVDTLRADMLSYRDENAPDTPAVDELARESVVFSNAISSSSWTFPAMVSIMTGLAPLQSSSNSVLQYETVQRPTIAQILRKNGYRTRAIVGNPLLYRPFHVAAGFDRIETYKQAPFGGGESWKLVDPRREEEMHSITTQLLTDQAIEWVRALDDQPSFLWLHYLDPHDPYLPPSEFVSSVPDKRLDSVQAQLQLYRGEVRFVDSQIARFLQALREVGVYSDAMLILTSDHGESFMEHNAMGHGTDLYQELLHVPLLIRLPGGATQGTVSQHVPTSSLLPTLLDLLHLTQRPEEGWSPTLAPLIGSPNASYDFPVISGANRLREPQWSIVMDDMKYIYREHSSREEVYDLEADPDEQRPLHEPPDDFVARAREALKHHLEFAKKTLSEEGMSPDGMEDEFRERLRALGYIQ